jgi:hypothetical protein
MPSVHASNVEVCDPIDSHRSKRHMREKFQRRNDRIAQSLKFFNAICAKLNCISSYHDFQPHTSKLRNILCYELDHGIVVFTFPNNPIRPEPGRREDPRVETSLDYDVNRVLYERRWHLAPNPPL